MASWSHLHFSLKQAVVLRNTIKSCIFSTATLQPLKGPFKTSLKAPFPKDLLENVYFINRGNLGARLISCLVLYSLWSASFSYSCPFFISRFCGSRSYRDSFILFLRWLKLTSYLFTFCLSCVSSGNLSSEQFYEREGHKRGHMHPKGQLFYALNWVATKYTNN